MDSQSDFESFWKQYPRKIGKKEAIKSWVKLSTCQQQKALEVIHNHTRSWEMEGRQKNYIPHCSTWLNQWRFDDEIELPAKQETKISVAWWQSETTMLEKGRELGTQPRPGEDWGQFKSRLIGIMQRAA